MAVIDVAGYVADLKDHSVDHGFHVHDERHFVETYSLRQVWEVELHPEDGCGGAVDLHLALEVDPRTLLSFEDAVFGLPEDEEPPDEFHFPLTFTWAARQGHWNFLSSAETPEITWKSSGRRLLDAPPLVNV